MQKEAMKFDPVMCGVRLIAAALGLGLPVAATSAGPLAPADVAAVYQAAGLQQREGAYRVDGCSAALKPQAEAIDLAADSTVSRAAGVLVYVGASPCFGETQGGNVALFVKDDDGRWTDRFGFLPGVEVLRQATSNLGWADLGVANPGGCMPVYRWNGSRYERHAQKAVQPGGCNFRE